MLNRYPLDRQPKVSLRFRRKQNAKASAKDSFAIPADTMPFLPSGHAKNPSKSPIGLLRPIGDSAQGPLGDGCAVPAQAGPSEFDNGASAEESDREPAEQHMSVQGASSSNISDSDVPDCDQPQSPQSNPDSSAHMLMNSDLSDGSGADGSVADVYMNRFNQSSQVISANAYSTVWQMQQRNAQQQRLRQVERNLRKSLNLSTILGATVVESAALFQAQQASLLHYCASKQIWRSVAQYCCNQSLAWGRPISPDLSEYPAVMAQIMHGNAVLLDANQPSPTADTRHETHQWLACWPGSWLLVPIQNNRTTGYLLNSQVGYSSTRQPRRWLETETEESEHWGILALSLPTNMVWSADAIAGAKSIALELSLAMNQAQQYESLLIANQELQKLALSDGLTQLANRRRFDEHLADEWQRLARDQRPLSLILCDLDHFKRYNDTFGHPAGDRCLIRVARALLSGPQRPADLVARYGGEEFAIILPNTDTNGAWRIAQKIHNSIRALKIAHATDNEKPYVTVTMGVSTIIPGRETTAQVLLQAADLALYHAKQQGRDRTYVHAHYNTVSTTSSAPSDTSNLLLGESESQPVTMTPSEGMAEGITASESQ